MSQHILDIFKITEQNKTSLHHKSHCWHEPSGQPEVSGLQKYSYHAEYSKGSMSISQELSKGGTEDFWDVQTGHSQPAGLTLTAHYQILSVLITSITV